MNIDKLGQVCEEVEVMMWEHIADQYPSATSGDLSPEAFIRLSESIELAVKEWVLNNTQGA